MARQPTSLPLLSLNFPETRNSKIQTRPDLPERQRGRKWVETAGALCLCSLPRTLKQYRVVAACGPAAPPSPCLPGSSLSPPGRLAAGKQTPYPALEGVQRHPEDCCPRSGAASERLATPHLAKLCPSLLDRISTSRRTAAPKSEPAAPWPITASLPLSPTHPPHLRLWMIHFAPYLEAHKSPPRHWPGQRSRAGALCRAEEGRA